MCDSSLHPTVCNRYQRSDTHAGACSFKLCILPCPQTANIREGPRRCWVIQRKHGVKCCRDLEGNVPSPDKAQRLKPDSFWIYIFSFTRVTVEGWHTLLRMCVIFIQNLLVNLPITWWRWLKEKPFEKMCEITQSKNSEVKAVLSPGCYHEE